MNIFENPIQIGLLIVTIIILVRIIVVKKIGLKKIEKQHFSQMTKEHKVYFIGRTVLLTGVLLMGIAIPLRDRNR